MNINNIEKQYNEDLDNLKKKINDYKDKFNQFKKVSKNTIKCNNNYLDLSKEKFDGYIFQGNGFCNASENRQFINNKDSSLNNQEQCKKICDSKDNCSGFTMFKPGTHVSTLEPEYEDVEIKKQVTCNYLDGTIWVMCGDNKIRRWGIGPEGKDFAFRTCDYAVREVWKLDYCSEKTKKLINNPGEKNYDNRCYWFKDEPIKEWSGSTVTKNNTLLADDVMCFKKNNPNMKMCPKETPDCNNGICMSKDSNLENLENQILTLNNDIINSFVKLNNDYKKYKNSSEMIKISKEIKLLNTIQDLEAEKQLLKMEKEQDITNNFGSRENIFKSENRYNNYLLLVVILVSYSIYSLYRGENYDNIDYIILFLILLYLAYVGYMTFYK